MKGINTMLSITKQFEFEAAHFLPNHQGACCRLHGHSYKLEIEVSGEPNTDELSASYGMIMDFGDLSKIVKENIIDVLDHHSLNNIILDPTAENLVLWIKDHLPIKVPLSRIRLWETSKAYCEWKR